MTVHSFPPYGVSSDYRYISVILERITWFTGISYNGLRGTEIHLDNGEIIRTSMPEGMVKNIIDKRLKE